MAEKHLAAVLPSRAANLVLLERPTPIPGPNEVLIEVKSIALNPIDNYQRAYGYPSINYPAVLGSDVAGIVLAVGSSMTIEAPAVGSRVIAHGASFFHKGEPDYGAFQQKFLVPVQAISPLPDTMSFNEGCIIGMALQTSWCGFINSGLTRETSYKPEDKMGMLIWGASSSVGSAAVQVAKTMGYTVYATSSSKHHEYIKGLGASRMFDYKDKDVVAKIVKAGKEDGIVIDFAFLAMGDLIAAVSVLQELKKAEKARVAMATFQLSMFWWRLFPSWRSTEVKFIVPPAKKEDKDDLYQFIFGVWLKEKLASGQFVPSPKIKLVEGGLAGIQKALDGFKTVSGEKLVMEL
ncbi:hypothetical protein SmJEL517_g06086 [Synchytrium microbalum]|uniref:Enoyl reductase (ER) domain-containing protein n=1 Tax=Synchytrium microbalum TaxID=1806994 RepID=A0A507BRG2_9FUNG|nr:uncharacterized protein SmJEL517_g06086 [Synchytrium microbalum]TPX30332.1 hypothetical protein SmJEL517_g06086 [Synchytrium microbalum]